MMIEKMAALKLLQRIQSIPGNLCQIEKSTLRSLLTDHITICDNLSQHEADKLRLVATMAGQAAYLHIADSLREMKNDELDNLDYESFLEITAQSLEQISKGMDHLGGSA